MPKPDVGVVDHHASYTRNHGHQVAEVLDPGRWDVTVNALFMSQAAYSEQDVRSMIADFEAANPGIKVKVQQIPWTAAHDAPPANKPVRSTAHRLMSGP